MAITPDDQMGRPIHSLVWAASALVLRAREWSTIERAQPGILDAPWLIECMDKDDRMRAAYMAALRLRAKEVCEYARSVGIDGMTPGDVRREPFLMAMAIQWHVTRRHRRGERA